MHETFHYGRRLSYDGDLCTVRYIGQVTGTKGEWLGVEWDDAARGKHNGQHGGIEYFKCVSIEPRPASFVRPSRPRDAAVSFVQALENKYVSDSQTSGTDPDAQDHDAIEISGKIVEEVGFEKIRRQLANTRGLRIVVLDESRIGSRDIGVGKDVGEACPNVFDLDMSRNLLETWKDVVAIITQLPRLSSLKLDGNRFSDLNMDDDQVCEGLPFRSIKSISLEDCLITWSDITKVTRGLPSLNNLAVGGNQIKNLEHGNLAQSLTHLSLERNLFESLDQLKPLSNLHSLQNLVLKGNHISSISSKSTATEHQKLPLVFPPAFQHIDLSVNEISTWHFITALPAVFPGLKSLRTSSNPLYQTLSKDTSHESRAEDGYMLTVARISSIDSLNFSPITPKLRQDAELFYLSQIAKELSTQPESKNTQILSLHPRYSELCEKYGAPVVNRRQAVAINPNSLAAHLLQLTFELAEGPAAESSATSSWDVEIPESFPIYNILGMLGRHYGLYAMHLKLVWETDEEEAQPENLDTPEDEAEQQSVPRLREERLEPKMRSIGSWLEGKAAKIRVEWDEEERRRSADVKKRIAHLMQ